jgi:hypothetical protein
VLFGTTDSAAVLAACNASYFGIQDSDNLNTFFADDGGNSEGAVLDDTLDIGRELTLAPGAATSFIYYQAFGTNSAVAQNGLGVAVAGFVPAFQSASQSNGTLTLDWSAIPGQTYQVQYKAFLSQTNWVDLGPPIVASDSVLVTTDSVSGNTQRFYRLVLVL